MRASDRLCGDGPSGAPGEKRGTGNSTRAGGATPPLDDGALGRTCQARAAHEEYGWANAQSWRAGGV